MFRTYNEKRGIHFPTMKPIVLWRKWVQWATDKPKITVGKEIELLAYTAAAPLEESDIQPAST